MLTAGKNRPRRPHTLADAHALLRRRPAPTPTPECLHPLSTPSGAGVHVCATCGIVVDEDYRRPHAA